MSKILIVDDEPAILNLLCDFVESLDYSVNGAGNGIEALEMLEKEDYDLVISDINMPNMKGFELLKIVRDKYPGVKRALITAYETEDFFELAMQHDVGNIIPKTTPFNFDDIEMVIRNLLTENIFGIERYLATGTEFFKQEVRDSLRIDALSEEVIRTLNIKNYGDEIMLVVVELLTNAVIYGNRKEGRKRIERWNRNIVLPEGKTIDVCWGSDKEKTVISVSDPFGRLTKKDALYWFIRQTKKNKTGLPIGVFDSHGRGLFISRAYMDSLIINIKSGFRTEIIAVNYLGGGFEGSKPLYINEI